MTVFALYSKSDEDNIAMDMGTPDYSYFFVLKEFRRLLETLGKPLTVRAETVRAETVRAETVRAETVRADIETKIEAIFTACRQSNEGCVFLSFTPPHQLPEPASCPTIPVFAWEFHDIPNQAWDDHEQHNWVSVLARHGRAITHSSFAVQVVRKAMGQQFPVVSIPAPVWDRYAALRREEASGPDLGKRQFRACWIDRMDGTQVPGSVGSGDSMAGGSLTAVATLEVDLSELTSEKPVHGIRAEPSTVTLEGVVYTTVLNPRDQRKNFSEILSAFCQALGEKGDATLVIKLSCRRGSWPHRIWSQLLGLRPFQCKVIVVSGLLPEKDYRDLARATTFAVNASSGEGQCLPLMEYMSCGIPAVAPRHTAMLDYVTPHSAFLVETTKEPCSWPQDSRRDERTFRHRLQIESLIEAFRRSYRVARQDPERYRSMSSAARESLKSYCSEGVVLDRLRRFLEDQGLA